MLSTLWHLLRTLMEPPSSYMPHLMSWIKQMDQTVRNQVTQLHGETLPSTQALRVTLLWKDHPNVLSLRVLSCGKKD